MLLRATRRVLAARSARCLSSPSLYPTGLAFAFDIDGVLKQGPIVLPQAKRVMQLLSGSNNVLPKPVPFLLMTNGGGIPDVTRRELLSNELGTPLGPNQLVQSHTPLRAIVNAYADEMVLVIGGPGDNARRVAESYGLRKAVIPQDILAWNPAIWDRYHPLPEDAGLVRTDLDLTQPFKAVFVLHDSHDWGRDLTLINELAQSDGGRLGTMQDRCDPIKCALPIWFTNPDLEWKSDYPVVRLGMGAFSLSVASVFKAATGADLPFTQLGKPHHITYEFADRMLAARGKELREPVRKVYMVGDNPLSDIWGANDYGWESILVRTGVYDGHSVPPHIPTFIADDVEQAVDWAITREIERNRVSALRGDD